MIRWNIAICDDEKAALELLGSSVRGALRARSVDAVIETFARPRDLLARMEKISFDLLFLDIEMPGMTGLELAQKLRREGNLIDIIYISNREDLVFDALRTNPRGFIRKTRLIQDVSGVIDTYLAYKKGSEKPRTLILQDRDRVTHIPLDKLQYIEGSGKNQMAHLVGKDQPMELHRSMQELEGELAPEGFLRIHKGYLLNYRFIRRIGDNEVTLTSGEKLPISRRKYQEIRDAYMEWMQNDGGVML
ncbi:MAG: response regulator transcription factor [Clostridia bacterium]|nr:response regulator transcription factor [Clostridia bacterium]